MKVHFQGAWSALWHFNSAIGPPEMTSEAGRKSLPRSLLPAYTRSHTGERGGSGNSDSHQPEPLDPREVTLLQLKESTSLVQWENGPGSCSCIVSTISKVKFY
ncbi:Hypothetical predicted protein [Pelobates cultripes]|uniref:Uncharacterized protein n=1 Tax=Pelobates cultripes TaxID=61616 RepID=A0AAD1VZG1_PELCU|nr:Hypothetical predicted protein [Pelobates cultripes]